MARRWPKREEVPTTERVASILSDDSEHPPIVIEGFVRDDMMEQYKKLPVGKPFEAGTVFLTKDAVPVVGMFVKAQAVCAPVWNEEFEEMVSYALLGGRITEVKEPRRIVVVMGVTNMPAPLELDCGDWEIEFVFRDGYRFPWVMEKMRKVN